MCLGREGQVMYSVLDDPSFSMFIELGQQGTANFAVLYNQADASSILPEAKVGIAVTYSIVLIVITL